MKFLKLLVAFAFISTAVASNAVKGDTRAELIAEQTRLLASGPWVCEEKEEDGTSYKSFDQYLSHGGYSGILLYRSPEIDFDLFSAGEWEIIEPGILSHPANGWFSFQNGLYSEEFGEDAYNFFIKEMTLEFAQLLGEQIDQRIIQLTNEKFSYLEDGGDEITQCTKSDGMDIRMDFGAVIIQ